MTRLTGRDQADVIASAAAGDEMAFKQIIGAHHDDMRRVCHYVTRDDAITDEAVQAAWAIAWRKLGSVRCSQVRRLQIHPDAQRTHDVVTNPQLCVSSAEVDPHDASMAT